MLRELEAQPYATPVGRTIFQKMCYVVTEMGVPTGFEFGKGSYGPFSADVKLALHEFANRNWLHEEQLGRMMALRIGEQYEKDRSKFVDQIERYQKKVAKAVDLIQPNQEALSRPRKCMTVLYASRQLKQAKPGERSVGTGALRLHPRMEEILAQR